MKKAVVKTREGFSGQYYFHSLHNNVAAYIREPGAVSGYKLRQFYLAYHNGSWFITDDEQKFCFLWGNGGGYFTLETKG